jgi:S-formylglutathione hydrolase FrmB
MTPELNTFPDTIPSLFFLHGMQDDASCIFRKTNLELLAIERKIAVIVADGNNSFYTNTASGENYGDFFERELIEFLKCQMVWFQDRSQYNYIGGISMGANGSLKLALKYPERFRKVFALSPPIDLYHNGDFVPFETELRRVFGSRADYQNSDQDVAFSFSQVDPAKLPPIDLFCGTEDILYSQNVGFDQLLSERNIAHTFQTWSGGHDWKFWNQCIEKFVLND